MGGFLVVLGALLLLCVAGIIWVAVRDWQPRGPRAPDDDTGLLWAGVVMMFLFPLGGFIAGVVLLAKGSPGNGTAVMLGSTVAGVCYLALGAALMVAA